MSVPGCDTAYFRDDHNRILRVTIHKESGEVNLHVLHTVEKEKAWVPFPSVDPISRKIKAFIEIVAVPYKELVEQARSCPLFKKD